jgi:UrcA family protein
MPARLAKLVVALALFSSNLGVAYAAEPEQSTEVVRYADQRTVQVRYGDLNLATEDGKSILMTRVARAVTMVCGGTIIDYRAYTAVRDIHACRSWSMADAIGQMHAMMASLLRNPSVAAAISVTTAQQ